MKRIRLFLLLSLLTLSMTAFADTFTDSEGRTWNFYGGSPGTAQLTGFSGTDLVIPATVTYNGQTAQIISFSGTGLFAGNTKIKTITFEKNVVSSKNPTQNGNFQIPENTFKGCTSLTTVDMGGASIGIGNSAFEDCTSLTTIKNPWNIAMFGDKSCRNCTKLETFYGTANVTTKLQSVGKYAFENCKKMEYFNLPFEVDQATAWRFGEGAFKNSGLKLIYIPTNCHTIPNQFCYGCDSLDQVSWLIRINDTPGSYEDSSVGTDVVYTPALSSIGDSAFMNCKLLRCLRVSRSSTRSESSSYRPGDKVLSFYDNYPSNTIRNYLPNLVTFGKSAFENCTNFHAGGQFLYFSSSNKAIYNRAFANTGLTYVHFEEAPNLELIDAGAFKNCSNLTTVKFATNNKLATIGDSAFYNDQNLKTMTFPTGSALTTIGQYAFYNCVGLVSNFKSLVNTKLTTVGEGAFDNCSNITYVDFPSTIQSIGGTNDYFRGRTFRNCLSLKGISISGTNNYYTAGYGNPLISKDGKVFICYPAKHTDHTGYNNPNVSADFVDGYLVPSTVTTISDYAFQGCQDLHIVLPKAVTRIGSYAFDQCTQMKEITIPENVTNFGSSIFAGCTSLKSIYFLPSTHPSTINGYTFGVTKANVNAYVKTTYLKNNPNTLTAYFNTVTNKIPYVATNLLQTRCFDFDADFSQTNITSGIEVYTISGYNKTTNEVLKNKITYAPSRISNGNSQASYTGVMIKATTKGATSYFVIGENANPSSVGQNYLIGCPGTHWAYSRYGTFTDVPTSLYALNAKGNFAQYKKAGRVPYNRAYLNGYTLGTPDQLAEIQVIFYDEDGNDVTAVEKLEAGVTETKENGAYYNLNGVKVENPTKGIYIHNGKKVVIK